MNARAQELYLLRTEFATIEREGLDKAHQLLNAAAARTDMMPVSDEFRRVARMSALTVLDATNRALEPVRASLSALQGHS
jgi:hypothetical protein